MTSPLDALVPAMVTLGHQLNSRFDADLFRTVATIAGEELWTSIAPAPDAEVVLRSYLRLVVEAVGIGCVTLDPSRAHRNLLSLMLVERVPALLASVPAGRRAHCLAAVWNLGEGLLAEPAWMNRYAAALCADLADLTALAAHLEAVLEPVLAARPPSQWTGPSTVRVLDTRPLRDDFLPGAMHLAAPSVVCLHDRRLPRTHVGVLLDHGGKSALLGLTPCMGANLHEVPTAAVEFAPNAVKINDRAVALPWLRTPHERLVTATGFVLASSVDSQRLWVIDTP